MSFTDLFKSLSIDKNNSYTLLFASIESKNEDGYVYDRRWQVEAYSSNLLQDTQQLSSNQFIAIFDNNCNLVYRSIDLPNDIEFMSGNTHFAFADKTYKKLYVCDPLTGKIKKLNNYDLFANLDILSYTLIAGEHMNTSSLR